MNSISVYIAKIFCALILVIYMVIFFHNPDLFNLWVLGAIFVLFCIFSIIYIDIEEKEQINFINNKKLFNETEMKYLEEITKNYKVVSDKYHVYEEYYDKRNEKKYEYMEKIIEELVRKTEISELSVELLKPYEKEINLNEYQKEELRKFFAEKVLEKELNSIKTMAEEKIKKDRENDMKIEQLIKELEL